MKLVNYHLPIDLIIQLIKFHAIRIERIILSFFLMALIKISRTLIYRMNSITDSLINYLIKDLIKIKDFY